jgi:hypothetical protein
LRGRLSKCLRRTQHGAAGDEIAERLGALRTWIDQRDFERATVGALDSNRAPERPRSEWSVPITASRAGDLAKEAFVERGLFEAPRKPSRLDPLLFALALHLDESHGTVDRWKQERFERGSAHESKAEQEDRSCVGASRRVLHGRSDPSARRGPFSPEVHQKSLRGSATGSEVGHLAERWISLCFRRPTKLPPEPN